MRGPAGGIAPSRIRAGRWQLAEEAQQLTAPLGVLLNPGRDSGKRGTRRTTKDFVIA